MAINKEMTMADSMGHETVVNYHTVKTINVNVDEQKTLVIIASYNSEAQRDWQKESFVKPPMDILIDGIDKTLAEIQDYILTLPEWQGATIVE